MIDDDVAMINKSDFAQTVGKRLISIGRAHVDKAHHRHRRLLRARHQGPRSCTAEPRDELAPFHSITSSARASKPGGISRRSAFAVFKLITNSNLVGCSIG